MKIIVDEHFSDGIPDGVKRAVPGLEITSVHARDLDGLKDPALLELLDLEGVTLVTRDVNTVRDHAADRLACGDTHGGLIFVPRSIKQSDEKEVLRRLIALIQKSGGEDWSCREEWL